MRYKPKRSYDWSPNMAYLVGLMASDGCLSSDGRHLDLTSVDLEQINNFNAALGRVVKVSVKSNGRGGRAFRAQFSDVSLYDFLIDAGLTPKKSLTLTHVNVPDIYFADFLRGLFDGDGSTYSYYDPRWPTSFLFYISFTAANYSFLEFLHQQNSRLFKTVGSSIRKGQRAYNLVYRKADSKILYDFLYLRHHGGLSLSRKRIRLEGFIATDSMVK